MYNTLMKRLSIQLQSQLCKLYDVPPLVDKLVTNARSHYATAGVSVTTGDDAGPYMNINIESHKVAELWVHIRPLIVNDLALSACVIACCEGDNHWDDYLLLFHYDKSEAIDVFP